MDGPNCNRTEINEQNEKKAATFDPTIKHEKEKCLIVPPQNNMQAMSNKLTEIRENFGTRNGHAKINAIIDGMRTKPMDN